MKPQGIIVECVYCKFIRPELQGKKKCPYCHGHTPSFRPKRMMDKITSERDIMDRIFEIRRTQDLNRFKKELIELLTDVYIYNFDFKSALITMIRNLETE